MALGNFDGLHRGHQHVIGTARDIARADGRKFGVLTFEPHPRTFFGKETEPFRLTTFRIKVRELQALGVDVLFVLRFDGHPARGDRRVPRRGRLRLRLRRWAGGEFGIPGRSGRGTRLPRDCRRRREGRGRGDLFVHPDPQVPPERPAPARRRPAGPPVG
ncbi:MAG: hypothetical protein JJ899_08015, partial [Alphaproteobacteria bacterium]|nr:hypothetical protein [Alphaproteobacteria bacterium]